MCPGKKGDKSGRSVIRSKGVWICPMNIQTCTVNKDEKELLIEVMKVQKQAKYFPATGENLVMK